MHAYAGVKRCTSLGIVQNLIFIFNYRPETKDRNRSKSCNQYINTTNEFPVYRCSRNVDLIPFETTDISEGQLAQQNF